MKAGLVTAEKIALLEDVKKDPVAFKRLKDKAAWEGTTLIAVLSGWGDPRNWDKRKTPALTSHKDTSHE